MGHLHAYLFGVSISTFVFVIRWQWKMAHTLGGGNVTLAWMPCCKLSKLHEIKKMTNKLQYWHLPVSGSMHVCLSAYSWYHSSSKLIEISQIHVGLSFPFLGDTERRLCRPIDPKLETELTVCWANNMVNFCPLTYMCNPLTLYNFYCRPPVC